MCAQVHDEQKKEHLKTQPKSNKKSLYGFKEQKEKIIQTNLHMAIKYSDATSA